MIEKKGQRKGGCEPGKRGAEGDGRSKKGAMVTILKEEEEIRK